MDGIEWLGEVEGGMKWMVLLKQGWQRVPSSPNPQIFCSKIWGLGVGFTLECLSLGVVPGLVDGSFFSLDLRHWMLKSIYVK
ncbi:hypothetical protein SCA6_019144 [Theobroma cacao]